MLFWLKIRLGTSMTLCSYVCFSISDLVAKQLSSVILIVSKAKKKKITIIQTGEFLSCNSNSYIKISVYGSHRNGMMIRNASTRGSKETVCLVHSPFFLYYAKDGRQRF
jgi:hypothetical protein